LPPRVGRRGIIGGLAALGLPLAATSTKAGTIDRTAAIDGWAQRIRSILARGRLPIIDPEATYNRAIDIDKMVQWMNAGDVAQVCFAPGDKLSSNASLELHRLHPQHFVPTTKDGSSPEWYNNREAFVRGLRADLASNDYFLLGEFELRHYPSPNQTRAGRMDRDVSVPLADPSVDAVLAAAAQSGLAVQVHYEIEDALLPPLEALLARHPTARVIWCHMGQVRFGERNTIYGVSYLKSLIARFPNLHFDLGLPGPPHKHPWSGQLDQRIYAATGNPPWGGYLRSEWRDFIEQHADRVLAASDIGADRYTEFPKAIERLRELVLSKLSPRAARLVAFENAWRLLTGRTWAS
jgi:hypothetical protein